MPAVSKSQQALFGLVKAVKAGKVTPGKVSKNVRDIAKDMSSKEINKFANTKTKGLPDKKKEVKKESSGKLGDMAKEITGKKEKVVKEAVTERNFIFTNKGKAFFKIMKEWTTDSDFDVSESFTDTYVHELYKFGADQTLSALVKSGFISPVGTDEIS